ncbi:MAG: hypothetical protein HYX92_06675 [Chloroflexi bacterium]|nr:hypothetical protein [Chloroflexota bacterium]
MGLAPDTGDVASVAFLEMVHPETEPARKESLGPALLAYCERDTEAMLRLIEVLRQV